MKYLALTAAALFFMLAGAVCHKPILRLAVWALHCDKTICK